MVKNFLQCRWSRFNSWIEKISWRRKWQPTSVFFPRKSRRGAGGPQSTGSQRVGHNVVTEQQDSLVPGEPHILPRTLVVTSVPGRSWPASYSSPFYGCGFQNPVSESVLESCFHRLVINYYFIIFWQRIKLLQPSEIYPFSQLRHVSVVAQDTLQRRGQTVNMRCAAAGHQKLTMTNRDQSPKPILQPHDKLPKKSASAILWLFGIWSKSERWKSSISWCVMSWLKIKKICIWSVVFS